MKDAVEWHSHIASEFDAKYTTSRAFKERFDVWSELIGKYATPESAVLDAGCGSGIVTGIAASRCRTVLAFDASPEMISICHRKQTLGGLANVVFREMHLEQLANLGEQRFDLLLCSSVLEYVKNFWEMFDALTQRLRPGGVFLFSIPNSGSLYRRCARMGFALTGYPRYYAYVRSTPSRAEVLHGVVARELYPLELRFYSPTPALSWLAHKLRAPRFSENLIVYVCRKR